MSIGYCKKCKLLYREPGTCICGRKLNTESEQYLDAYIDRGYELYSLQDRIADSDRSRVQEVTENDRKTTSATRQSRREEKKKQRDLIMNNSNALQSDIVNHEFDTEYFLASLGLRVKNRAA